MVSGEKQDRQRTPGTSAWTGVEKPALRGLGLWGAVSWTGRCCGSRSPVGRTLLSQPQPTGTDSHNTPPTRNVSK